MYVDTFICMYVYLRDVKLASCIRLVCSYLWPIGYANGFAEGRIN